MAKKPEVAKIDVDEKTDWPHEKVFIGIGQKNGGAVFVEHGGRNVRLTTEGPAFKAVMNTIGGARIARRASAKTSSL